jgi:hypothetical protein
MSVTTPQEVANIMLGMGLEDGYLRAQVRKGSIITVMLPEWTAKDGKRPEYRIRVDWLHVGPNGFLAIDGPRFMKNGRQTKNRSWCLTNHWTVTNVEND